MHFHRTLWLAETPCFMARPAPARRRSRIQGVTPGEVATLFCQRNLPGIVAGRRNRNCATA